MFVVKIPNKRTRVTFPNNPVPGNLHVHLRQFTLGTTDVFIDKLVQTLPEFFLGKIPINNKLSIILPPSFLEGSL